ncbi:excisionase family DNA-binding protein [Mycobacterium sp. ZZG]
MSKATPTPEFESLRSAAARTGFSVFTFRELVASGELTGYRLSDKPGSAIRVKRSDVDAMMKPVIPAAISASR